MRTWIIGLFLAGALAAADTPVEIKMATLAPEGSPWHKVLERMGERWRVLSNGQVRLKIFAGGTLGDEPDLVNKMKINQIQAVALTGAGMGEIDKGVMALQLPMMIESYPELDYVRDRLAPKLEQRINQAGFVVLSWGDAGWVHFFSRQQALHPDDLKKLKLFTWAGGTDELELWKANGFRPVPLAATDILMGLETGLIDAVPTVPLYALWNQCFGLAHYMNDIKWAPLVGATMVSRKAWDRVPEALRPKMLEAAKQFGDDLRGGIRKMGDDAIATMVAGVAGKRATKLTVVHADDAVAAEWHKAVEGVYPTIRGRIVPADLFDEAKRYHDEFRARGGARK